MLLEEPEFSREKAIFRGAVAEFLWVLEGAFGSIKPLSLLVTGSCDGCSNFDCEVGALMLGSA